MNKTLEILYADTTIIAVNKPSGMLSIPDRYDPDAPVALTFLESDFGELFVVHRIDKDTSGVLVYARNAEAHRVLNRQFATREVDKSYLALVRGRVENDEWECDLPLLVDADRQHRTIVNAKYGKDAFSRFGTVEKFRDYSLVRIKPETGRTHQVRVHCAATGYPIAADPLYGDGKPILLSQLKRRWRGDAFEERPLMARTALHAERIVFAHPDDRRSMDISAPLPKDFSALLFQLRKLHPQEQF